MQMSCPVCRAKDGETLLVLDCGTTDASSLYATVRLKVCRSCGHAYNGLEENEIAGLATYYETEYAPANLNSVVSEGDRPGSNAQRTHDRYLHLYALLSSRIQLHEPLLDVGCALGGFLDYLQGKGYTNLAGVERTAAYVKEARRKNCLTIEPGDAEALPFREGTFSAIVVEQVLEHLVSPARALREARRVLRKGGFLCVGVPDAERYGESCYFDFYWLLLREHVQHFHLDSLASMAEHEGFELVDAVRTDQPVMSDRMVMPVLYALFRRKERMTVSNWSNDRGVLRENLTAYIGTQMNRLSNKRRLLAKIADTQRPVYAWGIGREFFYLYAAAGLRKCRLAGLIDLNPFKQRTVRIGGLPVTGPDILRGAARDSIVVVTAIAHAGAIRDRLCQLGYEGEVLVPE
jgi:SAM-dependent methyltransferase